MVSVCIATYNGEKFIKGQIVSILSQLDSDDEIIVSDDGSSDNTLSIIDSLKDPRIHVYKNSSRHGSAGNFENALRYSKGDYIFFSDQDDVWFPNKKEIMLNYLQDYDLVHCNSQVTDEKLNVIIPDFLKFYRCKPGILRNIIKSKYFGSHMAFRSSVLSYSMPFPKSKDVGHDIWIGLATNLKGRVIFINEPLMYYRRNEGSETSIYGKSRRPVWRRIWLRLVIMAGLIKICFKK